MPKKTAPKKTAPKTQTKAAFVRSLPATTPAKEVVAKAKAAGISISENHVYGVRASTKASAKKKARKNAAGTKAAKNGSSRTGSSEATFRRLVLDLGLHQAKTLLAEVEHKLAALVAGR